MWVCGTLMMHVLYSRTAVSCSIPRETSELSKLASNRSFKSS